MSDEIIYFYNIKDDKYYQSRYTHEYLNNLIKENQALKEQVDYLRRSIERKEETIIELEQERIPYTNEYVDELKKQLEEYRMDIINGKPYIKLEFVLNQQKEFIEYLENMLDNDNDIFSVVRVKDVLSKYKEIIGGKDER